MLNIENNMVMSGLHWVTRKGNSSILLSKMDLTDASGLTLNYLKNPTAQALLNFSAKYRNLRGLVVHKDFYIWPASDAIHADIYRQLGYNGADVYEDEFTITAETLHYADGSVEMGINGKKAEALPCLKKLLSNDKLLWYFYDMPRSSIANYKSYLEWKKTKKVESAIQVIAKEDLVANNGLPLKYLRNPAAQALLNFAKQNSKDSFSSYAPSSGLRGLIVKGVFYVWAAKDAVHAAIYGQLGHNYVDVYDDIDVFTTDMYYVNNHLLMGIEADVAKTIPSLNKLLRNDNLTWLYYNVPLDIHLNYKEYLELKRKNLIESSVKRPFLPRKVKPKDSAAPAALKALPSSNACAIYSMALVLDLPIQTVWTKVHHRFDEGMTTGSVAHSLLDFGYIFKPLPVTKGKKLIDVYIGLSKAKAIALIFTNNHVIGLKNDVIVDRGKTSDFEPVENVWLIVKATAKDKRVGKFVEFIMTNKEEAGKLYGIMDIQDRIYINYGNGKSEGLIEKFKNLRVIGEPPVELYEKYKIYMKKYKIII